MVYQIKGSTIFHDAWVSSNPSFFKRALQQIFIFMKEHGLSTSSSPYQWEEWTDNPDHGIYLKAAKATSLSPDWMINCHCKEKEPYISELNSLSQSLEVISAMKDVHIKIHYEENGNGETKVWIALNLPEPLMEPFEKWMAL